MEKIVDPYMEKEIMKRRLIDLYQSATGKEYHRGCISDIQDMVNYYSELEQHKDFYRSLLKAWGVDFNKEETVEVGLGPVDSILKDNDATIVTPYCGIFNREHGKTYEGSYVVNNGEIEMLAPTVRKFEVETTPLDIGTGRIYLTHNILHSHDIRSWYKLSNNNKVVVGIYGLSSDKDRVQKVQAIRQFGMGLDDFNYNYGVVGNYYCEAIEGRPRSK